MWSYYGSKSKVVDLYPPPKFDKIIEPFAGSARYSLKYFDKDILLIDKYHVIVELWNYLKQASEKDILNLPVLEFGDELKNYQFLSKEEKMLLGFIIKGGDTRPANKPGSFDGCSVHSQKNILKKISKQLFKIRHWNIKMGSYQDLKNECVTWFIDPPYQYGGEHYKFNTKDINFNFLSNWCKERKGQSIVCENTKAKWMDFKPMKSMQGSMYKTTEAIWSNIATNYDNVQQTLF
jgi:site-specific DNA-adenine methylase